MICVWSSCFFLINISACFLTEKYIYGVLFVLLLTTSFIVHGTEEALWKTILDKLAIAGVVAYGGTVFFHSLYSFSIIHCFIVFTLFQVLYLYQYILEIRDSDIETANIHHAFLHFVVSMGHCLLALL